MPSAPPLLRGTGSDRVHLLLVCTAERGLCGPFNSAIVRLARERANSLIAQGKEVKFFCVGRKGYEQLSRQFERLIIEHVELRSVPHHRIFQRQGDRGRILRAVCRGRVRRLHAVLRPLQVGDRADSNRAADHPAGIRSLADCGGGTRAGDGAVYDYEPDEEEILAQLLPRNIAVQIFRRAAREQRLVLRRPDERDGQRHPQRRRNDPQADASATTAPARR